MRKCILLIILSFLNLNIFADNNIFGYWLTSGSVVKIENCNNQVCGKIITIFVDDQVDPESILDDNNKNKSLRDRMLIGIDLLSCLLYTSPSPRDGNVSRMPSSA